MLDEARADNKENDLEYMKPSMKSSCAYSDHPVGRAHEVC